jgi:hypothetical protein
VLFLRLVVFLVTGGFLRCLGGLLDTERVVVLGGVVDLVLEVRCWWWSIAWKVRGTYRACLCISDCSYDEKLLREYTRRFEHKYVLLNGV